MPSDIVYAPFAKLKIMTAMRPATAHGWITRCIPDWIGLIARLILGIALFYAGAIKVGNLEGNIAQVELYHLPIAPWMERAIGTVQPFAEIAVGLMLIAGLFTRINAILGVVAMAAFIAGISWAWSQGLRIDCGCFSAGGQLGDEEPVRYLEDIVRDLLFALAGIWLIVRPASVLAIDHWLLAPADHDDHDYEN